MESFSGNIPTPLELLRGELFDAHDVSCYVKRDDLIHAEIMGNKWRKLNYNFMNYHAGQFEGIVTLGGAYSNHLAAMAAACESMQIPVVAVVRGEELNETSNPTLSLAYQRGMRFRFVSRAAYREIRSDPETLKATFPNHFIVPEGGTNRAAIRGVEEVIAETGTNFDAWYVAIGTGGTFAGLVSGLKGESWVYGISSLKGQWVK